MKNLFNLFHEKRDVTISPPPPLKRSFVPETLPKDREKDMTHLVPNTKLCAQLKLLSVTLTTRFICP